MKPTYGEQYARLYANHWWWQARAAMLREMVEACELPTDGAILDVGCGDGLTFPMLGQFGNVSGLEVDVDLLDPDGPYRNQIHTGTLTSLTKAPARFDLITAFDVLEHIEDDRDALSAMRLLLRDDGYLLITVPAGPRLWTQHDDVNSHYRRYTAGTLRNLVAASFEVLDLRYAFATLVAPKLALAQIERFRGERTTAARQETVPPPLVNTILRWTLTADWQLGRRVALPIGTSLAAVLRKPSSG